VALNDRDWVESGRAAFGESRLESGRKIRQLRLMDHWAPGYTQGELDEAQERYAVRFPPDLIGLLLERQPANGYNWKGEDARIRRMLRWPLEMLLFDVEQGFWWPEWGERPSLTEERMEVVENAIRDVPKLIPLLSHRFIPEEPNEEGNPVFSMHGFDTIYYGANLTEYFRNEFQGMHQIGSTRHIPFWSDIVERPQDAYAFYAATGKPQAAAAAIQRLLQKEGD
jgi:hypothetical protein